MTNKIILFKITDQDNEDWFDLPYDTSEIKSCNGLFNYVQSIVDKHNILQLMGQHLFRDFKYSSFSDITIVTPK